MKKLLMFIGLKILEILIIIFVPILFGHILPWAKWFYVGYWLNGILAIIIPVVGLFFIGITIVFLIIQPILYWLSFNWDIVYKNTEKRNPFSDLIDKIF